MTDNSSSGVVPMFYVMKSGFGFEEGVYTQEELKSLPESARPHVISLAVAEAMGYVILDHSTGETLNELNIYAAPDTDTGLPRKLKGVREGSIENPLIIENTIASTKKLGNELREKLQTLKQKSAEDSLKAKIEAKKNELKTTKAK